MQSSDQQEIPKDVERAAKKFRSQLPSFYRAFAHRLDNAKGLSAAALLDADVTNYGLEVASDGQRTLSTRPRGVLARYWARRYDETGANLAKTLDGTIPPEDVAVIALAQSQGALSPVLHDLARVRRLSMKIKKAFMKAVRGAAISLLLMLGVLTAMPSMGRQVEDLWHRVAEANRPAAVNLFLSVAQGIDFAGLALAATLLLAVVWVVWSIPAFTGDVRRELDKWQPWRLYRDTQGILFLSTLSILIQPRGSRPPTLKRAIEAMSEAWRTPYMIWHLEQMLRTIGGEGARAQTNSVSALDTGILEQETYYRLSEIALGQGPAMASKIVSQELEEESLERMTEQATRLEAVLTYGGEAVVLVVVLWHIACLVLYTYGGAANQPRF